jgi:citronellol/citronellal dehydrogenase
LSAYGSVAQPDDSLHLQDITGVLPVQSITHAPANAYDSVFRPGLFAHRVAVVTGGGSGIGRCVAHELAALGARVVLVGRTLEKLQKVEQEIETGCRQSAEKSCEIADDRLRTLSVACDIRDEASVAQAVSEIVAKMGRIDFLINNAGGQFPAPLHRINAKGFDAVVRNNLTGGFLFARECYTQAMRVQASARSPAGDIHAGAIVNIIMDIWGAVPGMGHSGAARAGMLSLTETMALEWAPVRVNAVAPGFIATSGMDKYPPIMTPMIRNIHRDVPLQRLGTESEIAAAICFLLSPAAAFISGSCLRVDGAAPQARRHWPYVGDMDDQHDRQTGAGTTTAYNGFHLAQAPKVLTSGSWITNNILTRRFAKWAHKTWIRRPSGR